MKLRVYVPVLLVLVLLSVGWADALKVKLGEVARLGDDRVNQLIGYGLVIGLDGTGDSTTSAFTFQTMAAMFKRFGLSLPQTQVQSKNVAAVMVVAELPGYARVGDRLDCLASSLGDAKSLRGGVLLQTPLLAADGQVYAVAQGPISLGGYSFSAKGGGSKSKNHQTTALVPKGAVVERALRMPPARNHKVVVSFHVPGYRTVSEAVISLQKALKGFDPIVRARDEGSLEVEIPPCFWGKETEFINRLAQVEITYYRPARVVVNERTGSVIIGGDVRIMPVAVSQGSLTVEVKRKTKVIQPPPLSGGSTVVVPENKLEVQEKGPSTFVEVEGMSVGELVTALNAIGATTGDIISILQAIKAAGALTAELVVM